MGAARQQPGSPGRSRASYGKPNARQRLWHALDTAFSGLPRRGLRRLEGCRVARYCLAHASCPVLAIPPPPWPSKQALAFAAGHPGTAGPMQQLSPRRGHATVLPGPGLPAAASTTRSDYRAPHHRRSSR